MGKRLSPLAFLATLPQAGGLLRGRQAVRLGKLLQTKGFLLLAYLLLAGCGSEKESLFEEEHDLPAHWPSGLVDAVDKIDQRISRAASVGAESEHETEATEVVQSEQELRDLVEWIPEVAADTDLSEAQWVPIYEMCEVMREHLSRGDVSAFDLEEDFRKLQALLTESAQLLPTPADDTHDSTQPATRENWETEASPGDES